MTHKICKFYKHTVEYDFSVTTIRYLMSALQMLNTSPIDDQPPLRIHFRNSLRLLPLQDIIELYDLCSKKKIDIKSMKGGSKKYQYHWESAINISKSYGKDVRLLKYARDNQGVPYIMKLMQLSAYNDRRKIFRSLIKHDFDLNIHDLTTNESIVYTLLRSYDYKNLKYIFRSYGAEKGVLIRLNYHNKDGISPLGIALKLYEHEVKIRNEAHMPATVTVSPFQAPFLWQILVKYGAELSFPCKKNKNTQDQDNNILDIGDMSPLQFVLKELRNKQLARHLMDAGAQLYAKEIGLLNDLFVNYQLNEEPTIIIQQTEEKQEEEEEEEEEQEQEQEWKKNEGYIEHEEDAKLDTSWIGLLCEVANRCGRPIDFITDEFGNNPLHFFINDFNKKNKHKTKSVKMKNLKNALKLRRLQHLMYICNGSWTNEKNNNGDYPFQLIVKKRDPDLFFEFANLDKNFKQSIMERKEFVQQIIDWILAITERITKKYPNGLKKKGKKYQDERIASDVDVQTLDKLFNVKYLGKLIKWPNKYKKVINEEEISLIGIALDRKLIKVTLYLKEYWKFPLKKTGREKLQQLIEERENEQFLSQQIKPRSYNNNNNNNNKNNNKNNNNNNNNKQMNHYYYKNKRKRTSTKEILSSAPAPVLRQHTLAPSNNMMINPIDIDMGNYVDRSIQASKLQQQQDFIINKDGEKSKIEIIYSFIVESLSTADLVTDILVIIALINKPNPETWWITFMLLFMMSPYLVSHSIMCSLIDSRRDSLKLDLNTDRGGCGTKCGYRMINTLSLFIMTPMSIVWFTLVDVTFMIYLIVANLMFFTSCGRVDISDKMDDLLFRKCLGMSRMQIIGYRRLRTLSQLLFETLPQIGLQAWILYTYQYRTSMDDSIINQTELYISIVVAAFHVILELLIIYLDARASDMPISHYAVVCLGARLNWVPFGHKIRRPMHTTTTTTRGDKGVMYNFECIEFQPWFFAIFGNQKYRIEYEFSPSSIKKLGEYFINLPILSSTEAPSNPYCAPIWLFYYKRKSLPTVYFGETCCRSLDIYSFAEFFRSADKKVILKSSKVDWTRIIFENTPNISCDNVYLKRLCEEFINYAEIKLITQLAPLVKLNGYNILLYILNVSSHHNILLILKKYYDENIYFGLNIKILENIYKLIRKNRWIYLYRGDPSYAKVIFLLMWYTRRTIFRHQDPRGDLKFIHDPRKKKFLQKAIEMTLPIKFTIEHDSTPNYNGTKDLWNRQNNDDAINKVKTVILNSANSRNIHKSIINTTTTTTNDGNDGDNDELLHNDLYDLKEEPINESDNDNDNDQSTDSKASNYQVEADWNEQKKINLADEDDDLEEGFVVEFEILECFKYFQPQIEKYLIDLTKRNKTNNEKLKVRDRALFKFFKKVFNRQSMDFLKLIINFPWNVLQQFPIHVRFAELFGRLDPVVRRLEMVHGYGKYLLASSRYRQTNKSKPFTFIISMEYDNHAQQPINNNNNSHFESQNLLNLTYQNNYDTNQILNIQTDPAYHGHKQLRSASYNILPNTLDSAINLSDRPSSKIKQKYQYDKDDVMGISRIEIRFDEFNVITQNNNNFIPINRDDDDNDNDNDNNNDDKSLGKIQLFTILPQKTQIANDKLMLNKVVLKEISFEELNKNNNKLIVDLYDNQVLGLFRPIYVGRDRIELMPLKLLIEPKNSTTKVTCNLIEANIIYLLRRLVDATSMKFEVTFYLFISFLIFLFSLFYFSCHRHLSFFLIYYFFFLF